MLFTVAIGLFSEHLNSVDRSPKTVENYKYWLLKINENLYQKQSYPAYVEEVKPDDIEKYIYEPPNDKNFTQVTRWAIVTAIKSFYSFCYKKGYCKTNLGTQLTPIKAKAKERTFIAEDELLKIAAQINNQTDKTIMQTMFYTGMRIGEATSLTFEDFHFDDNYIYIRKHKSRYDRKIPISIKLRLILNDYLEYRNELETDSNKVFVDEYRGEITESHFNKMIKRAAKKAGLDANISSHIMRHSFASNLIAKGVDIVKVKKLLGHEKIETTNIYLHTNMHLLRNAIDKL